MVVRLTPGEVAPWIDEVVTRTLGLQEGAFVSKVGLGAVPGGSKHLRRYDWSPIGTVRR